MYVVYTLNDLNLLMNNNKLIITITTTSVFKTRAKTLRANVGGETARHLAQVKSIVSYFKNK